MPGLRGKEKDLIIEKLEKNHGINSSNIYKVAKVKYAYKQYKEVRTKKACVEKHYGSPATCIEKPRMTPCLQLLPGRLQNGILVFTESKLIIFDVKDEEYEYPLYQFNFKDINSMEPVKSPCLVDCGPALFLDLDYIVMTLDDKNALVFTLILLNDNLNVYNFMLKKGIKELNNLCS
jgi:hypothetical protein